MTAFMIRYHFLSLNLILFLKKLSFSYSNIVVLYKSLENTKKQKEKLILIPAIYFGIFNLFGRIFFSVAMIIYDIQNGIYLFGENICFKILQFFFSGNFENTKKYKSLHFCTKRTHTGMFTDARFGKVLNWKQPERHQQQD